MVFIGIDMPDTKKNSEEWNNGVTKVDRYKWKMDSTPGEFAMLEKNNLQIHPEYQRAKNERQILRIAGQWSWVSLGVITVARRGGELWVIDGQHRVAAAKKRADIQLLPCIVFDSNTVKDDALAFLTTNIDRKPMSSHDKHRAKLVAGDEFSLLARRIMDSHGISLGNGGHARPMTFRAIGWAEKKAQDNPDRLDRVMGVLAEICQDAPMADRLAQGLWYMDANIDGGIHGKRLRKRLKDIGGARLMQGANKAAGYFAKGGEKVYATGMLDVINHGLQNKIEM